MKRIIIFFLIFFVERLFATEVEISISVENPTIGLNDRGLISIELNKKAKNIIPPQSKDFVIIYAGVSESSQLTIINGKMQSRHSYIYNFFFIPKKLGRIEVFPFSIEIDKTYQTKPVFFNVIKNQPRKKSVDPLDEIENLITSRIKIPTLKLKLLLNKQVVYQNQPLIIDLYLYSDQKEALDYSIKETSPIRTDKSIYYDISQTVNSIVEKDGIFYRKLLKRFVFYPVESGMLAIAPPVFVAITPYGQLEVKGDNVGVDVKPFKEGFKYIGELETNVKINTNTLKVGEILTITLTLKGNGNLKLFSQLYDKIKIENLFISKKMEKITFTGIYGKEPYFSNEIVFEVIPEKEGDYKIPPLRIEYYNTTFNRKEVVFPEIKFKVLPINNDFINENLEYRAIKETGSYKFIIFNPFLVGLFIIIFLLPFFSIAYNYFKNRLEKDTVFRKKFLANKKLSTFLFDAEKALAEKDYKLFYHSLGKAIFYYITDKYNIPASLSFKEVLKKIENRVDDRVLKALKEKYDYCQMAYSVNIDNKNARDTLEEVKKLLILI